MTIIVIYLLTALNMALMIWGQQTFAPIIPTFPPNPTRNPVINGSVVVSAGEPVIVSDDIRLVIDCGQLIDRAIMSGIPNPTVIWHIKDGPILRNETAPYIILSRDRRRLIITDTLVAVGGQLGNKDIYTCDVCTDFMDPNCSITTNVCICGEPNISPPENPILVTPGFVRLTCGENVTVPTLQGVASLVFQCSIFNGSDAVPQVFKNNVSISNRFPFVISPVSDDDFGTYTFRVSTPCCGSAVAVSRIIRQGFAPDIVKGVEGPMSASRGVIRVKIGTPVYVTDMFNVTIDCNITEGTHPIKFNWLHNNALVNQTRGSASSITIPVANAADIDGDVYTCRANNSWGYDMVNTTIYYLEKMEFCIIP